MIEIPLLTIITKLLTIGVRLSGLMLFAPFFGSVVIPVRVKAILVLRTDFDAVSRRWGSQSIPRLLRTGQCLSSPNFLSGWAWELRPT